MKVAIDVSPLESGHKVRGVGFYLTYLRNALLKYFPDNEYVFFTQKEAMASNIDLVHYPYFDPFSFTLPFKRSYKTVVTVHDLTPLVFPSHFPAGLKGNLRWQLQRFNLQNVDAILTDSKVSKNDIKKIAGVSDSKVDIAYLAAGEEFEQIKNQEVGIKEIKKKYNLPHEFILYVGDVTWNKNLPRLLQAVKDNDIPLVMVGKALVADNFDKQNKWNSDLVEIQKLAQDNKNVLRLGFVSTEDLVMLYNLATAFVFPSVYEGFGLPIVEAMQSGCPVIISHEGCMPEVGGDAAYYFDGYDTKSLTEAIIKVFNSKVLQKELSEKGLKQAKKFSWEKTAEMTVNVYKKVLQ